ncbi:DMT family transporter [Fusobacterium sp.]|uniref:DMT family transporter n=1 Tax=Fusobacterium sp. TaxID=68766 RepID=UPI002904525E|nr:DMT family transporter [Fusobacterium sp.]MDU1910003.1 DMT family transporter [Fusobacterium sp.]
MDNKNLSLLQLHAAVFLFGISGLFTKFIVQSSIIIVLGRVFFSSIFLLIGIYISKESLKLKNKKDLLGIFFMGAVLAIHWCTFFQGIKLSTVAIGLLTFSTFPIFVTFMEPFFFHEKLRKKDICLAFMTFIGILFVIPDFQVENKMTMGAIFGIISSFSYAVLSLLNRKYVKKYKGVIIAFYEQVISFIILLPFFFIIKPVISEKELLLLLLLGTVFTGIAHTLFISSLKNVKTQTAGIISSLEPLYGIVFSIFLLNEFPSIKEIIGGTIILGTVFYSTMKNLKNK